MSAIAYITDSKMLELHRLNNHKTMNFWRPSGNINFSEFKEGDLLFFLSKDKQHRKKKEKGIVGFGRLVASSTGSVRTMWERFGILNGYNDMEEFREAIAKVSKDKKIPSRISGFYLENVTFFQPVYLSECGMKISNNIESYVYLKPEEVVMKLLDLAGQSNDLWFELGKNEQAIEEEKIRYALIASHRQIGDIPMGEREAKKAARTLKSFQNEYAGYAFIQDSRSELYKIGNKSLDIVLFHDKYIDRRLLIGQAHLYRYFLGKYYKPDMSLRFLSGDRDENVETDMNALL